MTTATGDFVHDFKIEPDADPFTDPDITFFLDSAQIVSGLLNSKWVVTPRLLLVDNAHSYGTTVTSRVEKNSPSTAGGECGPGLYDSMGNGYELKAYYEELRLFRVTLAASRTALGGQVNLAHAAGSVFGLSIDASGNLIGYLNGVDIGFGAVTDTTFPSSTLKAGAYSDRDSSGGGFASGVFSFAGSGIVASESVTLTSPVQVGGTGYSAITANMGTITSITNGTVTGTSTDAFTYSMNPYVNGVVYLGKGAGKTQTVGDGTKTTSNTATINPMAGYSTVVVAGTVNTGEWALGKDPAFVVGVEVDWPTAMGTVNADTSLTDVVFGTYSCWMRDLDGEMYSFTLTVTESGVSFGSSSGSTIFLLLM